MRPSVFVNIAAYRDPDLKATIRDLLAKAAHPDRITIGMVQQTRPEDEFAFYSTEFNGIHIDAQKSKGACWARHLGYTLYRGEDYILQIDAHMRFADCWDEEMLAELAACPAAKPMLTTYAPEFAPPNFMHFGGPTIFQALKFDDDGHVFGEMRASKFPASGPRPTALVSGHFMFARAEWISEVPYDPQLYFFGEEITLAARPWTNGWDLFSPSHNLVWHYYLRDGRFRHWDDHGLWGHLDFLSRVRARRLLGMSEPSDALIRHPESCTELDRYGLGAARSLAEYQHFSGIDFQARTITPRESNGGIG